MSLQSRLAALIVAVGADISELKKGPKLQSTTTRPVGLPANTLWYDSDYPASGVPAAISASMIASKGDLIAGTADDAVAILPASASDGQSLVTDPTAATGLKWSNVFRPTTSAAVGRIIRGLVGQASDLEQFQDSNSVVLSAINSLGQFIEGGRRVDWLTSRLTTAATTTSVTYSTTGLSVTLVAGKVYHIRARGQYRSSVTTTGIGLRLGGTATAVGVRYESTIQGLSATTYTPQTASTMGAAQPATTGVAVINTDYGFLIEGEIRVSAAGTLTLDFMSEIAGSTITVQPDSTLMVKEVA